MRDALREHWPDLRVPWRDLGVPPVALAPIGSDRWVLDEGRVGADYGGNKVRKLEFLLGEAIALEVGDLLTMGAVGSHHVVATALYASRLGLRTHAALFPQPDHPHVRVNARLIDALCEGWAPAARPRQVPGVWLRTWTALRVFGRGRLHVIPAGGSSPTGVVGWVGAGLELAAAMRRGDVPAFDAVYTAYGSGGTAAGLALGLAAAGMGTEVVAVRVLDARITSARRVAGLIRRTGAHLARCGGSVGRLDPRVRVEGGWLAGGYGRSDGDLEQAAAGAEAAGLSLDPTYSVKAWGAFAGHRGGPALFVQTCNTFPLDDLLREALPDTPARMRPLLLE